MPFVPKHLERQQLREQPGAAAFYWLALVAMVVIPVVLIAWALE